MPLLFHWLANAAALWVAAQIVPGLSFSGGLLRLLLVAAVFGLVNATLRPLLAILTCPLVVLTLGLFTLVLNAVMLLVTGWLSTRWGLGFSVAGFWSAFLGGLVVGFVSLAVSLLLRRTRPSPT